MKTFHYQPTDVCVREMIITVDGDTLTAEPRIEQVRAED